MKIQFKKNMRKLHLWVSLPFGILFSLICFSASMLVFEKEITQWIYPDLYFVSAVPPNATPRPLSQIMQVAQEHQPQEREITSITLYPSLERTYRVGLSGPGRAALYIDPYTAEVKGMGVRPAFFETMSRMHRRMLFPISGEGADWGRNIVGITTWAMVLVLITGVIIWIPRYRKTLKNRLTIPMRKGGHYFLRGLHLAGGIYATLFLLMMAFTGLTWSYEWYNNGVYKMLGYEKPEKKGSSHRHRSQAHEKRSEKSTPTHYSDWQKAYEMVAPMESDAQEISIESDLSVKAMKPMGINARAYNRYQYNPQEQRISETELYTNGEPSSRVRSIVYSLHTGQWAGMVGRIVAFLTALLGYTLPLTGYYIWLRHTYFPRPKRCGHKKNA